MIGTAPLRRFQIVGDTDIGLDIRPGVVDPQVLQHAVPDYAEQPAGLVIVRERLGEDDCAEPLAELQAVQVLGGGDGAAHALADAINGLGLSLGAHRHSSARNPSASSWTSSAFMIVWLRFS